MKVQKDLWVQVKDEGWAYVGPLSPNLPLRSTYILASKLFAFDDFYLMRNYHDELCRSSEHAAMSHRARYSYNSKLATFLEREEAYDDASSGGVVF